MENVQWKTYEKRDYAKYQPKKKEYKPDIIRGEVVVAFNKLKQHKTPGSDEIISEMH